MVAEEVQVLPNEVSHVLACNCKAAEACKRAPASLSKYHAHSSMHVTQPNATMNGQ